MVRRRSAAPDRVGHEAEPLVRRPGHLQDHAQRQRQLGGTAFSSKTLFVGGAGSKALRNPDNSLVRVDCPAPGATPRSGAVEMTIPSYASDPVISTPNPCPDAALVTAVTRLAGNPGGEIDEWGRQRDRMRVEYRFEHMGPGPGAQNAGLDWSASWK